MSFESTSQILEELKALARSMATGLTVAAATSSTAVAVPTTAQVHKNRQVVQPPAALESATGYSTSGQLHADPTTNLNQSDSSVSAALQQHQTPRVGRKILVPPPPVETSAVMSPGDSQSPLTPLDMDGSVCDGVKTMVLFLNSDPERFEMVTRSLWEAEIVQEGGGGAECDDDDDDDLIAGYRLPSFPFGGGVSDAQDRYLYHRYCEVLHAMRSPKKSPKQSASVPAKISKDAFDQRQFSQALEGSATRSWKPKQATDFVVEVDADVRFDAHSAKADRRLQLYESLAANPQDTLMATVVNLRVIMDPLKTGFEEDKEYRIEPGNVVANRFQIADLLGKATFSRAVRAHDLHQPIYEDGEHVGFQEVCLKIINNSKEFFDQSLDEIRLLQMINSKRDPDEVHVVRLIDFFYHKEHTFLVTELLSDNLYEYAKFNREHEEAFYFTLPRLKSIARQVTEALAYIHSLNLMHCDLKPENILFVSHRRCVVKVIDFGSSCFLSDHLSSYIQSRSYRAPEVILGADYDGRIDVWSLGAILVELVTGDVLFSSETVPEMLARIVAVCGHPFPKSMLWEGRHTHDFFTKFGCIYEVGNKEHDENAEDSYYLYTPLPLEVAEGGNALSDAELPYAMLRAKLAASGMEDPEFIDFVEQCLTLDHKLRPTSCALLNHPFLHEIE